MISVKLGLLLLLASYISPIKCKCRSDEDCDGGKCSKLSSWEGHCIPKGTCYRDWQCNTDEKCVDTYYPTHMKPLGDCEKAPKGYKRWCWKDEHCNEGEKCIENKYFGDRCEKDESEEPEESKETMEVKERKPCGDGSSCDWDEECATGCVHWPPRPTWPPPPCCKKIFPPPTEETTEQEQPTKKCYKNSDCPQGTECRGAEDCSHACSIGWGCIPIACFPHQG